MENGKHIKVLTLQFDTVIKANEIGYFRGAVLNAIGNNVDILFHNHTENKGFRYSYPLIQYKILNKKAAIVCVENGVDSIGQFLMSHTTDITLGNRPVRLEIRSIRPQNILMQTWSTYFSYNLAHWLPLNEQNYRRYQEMVSLSERLALLESILVGNLLSMCKNLGIYLTEELKVSITHLSEPYAVRKKGIKVMSFDVDFQSNLSIPDGVGIGKDVSIGFGTIRINRKEKPQKTNDKHE